MITLEKWIQIQEALAKVFDGIDLSEKEAKKLIRFFGAMVREKARRG